MDLKDCRHRSLTGGHCTKDPQYNTSSLDADECRVPTQKSYSSSDTLKAFDHEQRLHYGGCVTDLVHHEADEYSRQGFLEFSPVFLRYFFSGGNFTLAELGVCESTPPPHPTAVPYCPDLSLLQRGYSLSAGSDADSDPDGPLSPERAIQLWTSRGGVKSRRSSGVSSRENSALTLTDSENDKSDEETAYLDDEEDEDLFGDCLITILTWLIVSENDVEKAMQENYKLPRSSLRTVKTASMKVTDEDQVDVKRVQKYFTAFGWQGVVALVDRLKSKGQWLCNSCTQPLNTELSVGCDACLQWYDGKCLGLKQAPKSKTWICRNCLL